jgi:hypothetical protein
MLALSTGGGEDMRIDWIVLGTIIVVSCLLFLVLL